MNFLDTGSLYPSFPSPIVFSLDLCQFSRGFVSYFKTTGKKHTNKTTHHVQAKESSDLYFDWCCYLQQYVRSNIDFQLQFVFGGISCVTEGRMEWGYLEKRSCKNLIFWICNIKQLNFSHFNTNSKFFPKRKQKRLQKMSILFCLVYQRVFGHIRQFPIIQKISKEYRRFTNSAEDFRRVLKMLRTTAEDFRGEIRKFSTLFSSLYSHVKDIFFTVYR